MIEGSGSGSRAGSGSIPQTSGSGSGRPKNTWIRWIRIRIRIRIRNTGRKYVLFEKNLTIFSVILPLFANFSAKQTKNCLNCHWRICLEWFFCFGFEIRWRTLKSSPFELRWSDSYFESPNGFVGQFSSNWHANRWNPTKVARTEANFWLRTLKTTPIRLHLSDFDFE
jgi:hypothetical protein